jgi:glycine/D-amino acid oxidase-like deaminating enzyme
MDERRRQISGWEELRSCQPYWILKNGLLAVYPPLEQNATCEVAVLGAGITGALLATYLCREGVDTLLLDKRDVAMGSTAASTALLMHEIDVPLSQLARKLDPACATRAYYLGLEAINAIESLTRGLGDDCGFARKECVCIASGARDVKGLREEFEHRKAAGFDVEFLGAQELAERSALKAPAAILSRGNAQVDPFRLTHRLLAQSCERGLRVYDRSEVTEIERVGGGVLLKTRRGPTVQARKVIFATGYESQKYLREDVGELTSTFALVSEPLESGNAWQDRFILWETARPYFYLGCTADGRALLGGEDDPYAGSHQSSEVLEHKSRRLAQRFRSLFPTINIEIAYVWGGTFAETKDGLPYIGESSELAEAYFALSYGANGITFGQVAAKILTDLYLGRKNSDAELFRFGR